MIRYVGVPLIALLGAFMCVWPFIDADADPASVLMGLFLIAAAAVGWEQEKRW